MVRVWVTGINKSTVLQGRLEDQVLKKIKKKRKNRPAAKSRSMKKARATRRAAADAPGVQSSQGTCKGKAAGAGTSRAAGAVAVEKQQGVRPLHPSCNDTDQTAATSHSGATDHTDPGTGQPGEEVTPDWLCLICTFMNCEASATCSNCKRDRPAAVVDDVSPETVRDAIAVAQMANDTDHMTAATAEEDTDTNQTTSSTVRKATRTVRKSTCTDQMFYPIYDEYYKESELTVGADYATTTETWQVAYINDRRQTPLGLQYHVLWVHPDRSCKKLYLRTWDPRSKLAEDDFEDEMAIVDRWKASNIENFEAFWKKDSVGRYLLGADTEGLCLFNALKRAAELGGRPDVITQQDIDQFVHDELVLYHRDLSKGTTWKIVLRFLRRLRDSGRDFIYNAIANYNYVVPGRRGARVLAEIKLADGIYIVAAYNYSFVGHGFVLTVQGKTRLIYDLQQGKPIASAEDWINFYSFVRPFVIIN